VPIVLKSENLSLLEPSGPVQTCNVIDLPLTAVSADRAAAATAVAIPTQFAAVHTTHSYSRPNSNSVCCSPHNAQLQPSQFLRSLLQSTQRTATAVPNPTQFAAVHTTHRYSRPNSISVCCSPHNAPLQPSQFQLSLLQSTQRTATAVPIPIHFAAVHTMHRYNLARSFTHNVS
jgi:hypothetical protein